LLQLNLGKSWRTLFSFEPVTAADIGETWISRIRDDLFLGRIPEPEDVAELQALGITHVVTCLDARQAPRVAFLADEFQQLTLHLEDLMETDISEELAAFFDFAAGVRHAGGKLLIHCESGVSRSATFAIAHEMNFRRKTFLEAFNSVRKRRRKILPNIGFATQLQELETHAIRGHLQQPHSSLAHYLKEVCQCPAHIDLIESMLRKHDHDAESALKSIYANAIPRVIQGVR